MVNQGTSDRAGFYVEYKEGDINGRISIAGKRAANYYSLEASLAESSDAKDN
jgi:hypothetical protein